MESAFIEQRYLELQQIERANMTICELESQKMNIVLEEKYTDPFLAKCKEGLVLKNVQEARATINQLIRVCDSKIEEMRNRDSAGDKRKREIEALEE